MQIEKNITVINIKGTKYLNIPLAVKKVANVDKTYKAIFTVNDESKEIENIALYKSNSIKDTSPTTTPEKDIV